MQYSSYSSYSDSLGMSHCSFTIVQPGNLTLPEREVTALTNSLGTSSYSLLQLSADKPAYEVGAAKQLKLSFVKKIGKTVPLFIQ